MADPELDAPGVDVLRPDVATDLCPRPVAGTVVVGPDVSKVFTGCHSCGGCAVCHEPNPGGFCVRCDRHVHLECQVYLRIPEAGAGYGWRCRKCAGELILAGIAETV